MNGQITRPALDQNMFVGALYDARVDTFLPQSFLIDKVPSGVISQHDLNDIDTQVGYADTYAAKLDALHIGPDLSASILSGLIDPAGLGQHIIEQTKTSQSVQAFVYHTMIAVREKLELSNRDLKTCVRPLAPNATHIVVEVGYGAQTVITLQLQQLHDQMEEQGERQLRQMTEDFASTLGNIDTDRTTLPSQAYSRITAHSTVVGPDGIVLNNTQEARDFLQIVPLQMQRDCGGKGRPIFYKMLPVQMLSLLHLAEINGDTMLTMPSQECMGKFVHLCDEFLTCRKSLQSYQDLVLANKHYLPTKYVHETKRRLEEIEFVEQRFRTDFGQKLLGVRAGKLDSNKLWQDMNDAGQDLHSPTALSTITENLKQKLSFIKEMIQAGATYSGYNGLDIRPQLTNQKYSKSFVLYFSDMAYQDQESWTANRTTMLSLLNESSNSDFLFAIVDCDAIEIDLERLIISQFEGGSETVHDLQAQQQYLSGVCLARRFANTIDTEQVPKPTKRRFVNIPCPGQTCSEILCEWKCATCHASLEYGYTDQYIYCECGRSEFNAFEFKCNDSSHGKGFEVYDVTKLLPLLKSLDQSNCLNILVLGETGVGKSTFVNAFVNYLQFNTLDDALANDDLNWVIPCSFAIQTMDRSKADNDISETKIQVGSRADEVDGVGGRAATQKTQVYPITVEGKIYRLIDTPGIGDPRGPEVDKTNMEDILKTVSGYDHLHGILILLKPNNARLTAQFSFCIKELLTHLHRDATNNVVFGFTNTRISHYTPGDTLGPLKSLLEEHKDIGLTLTTQTTYCFDSESFRYLAAAKNGLILPNKPDFDSSWSQSRSEAELMLKYFRNRDPHPIKSTISLNATRNLILELVKPMTEITQLIRTNIELQKEDVKLLQDHFLTGDELKAKLYPEKQLWRKRETSMPRTVCQDTSCMQFLDDGNAAGNTIVNYPNPCHSVCFLVNVTQDVRAHPAVMNCCAFQKDEYCQRCHHHWTMHLHILYELESYSEKVLDHGIQKLLQENASETVQKDEAVKRRNFLIAEYEKEHVEIQETAANFGVWMRANSILPYNDATVAYLEVLIKAEQAKVDAGGLNNKKVLADLQEDLRKHQELIRVLDESMKNSGGTSLLTQDDIQQMVQRLYKLKHFGHNLESLKILNQEEHERTNRERPHLVKTKHQPRRGMFSKSPSNRHSSDTYPVRTLRRTPSTTDRMPDMFVPHSQQYRQHLGRRSPSPKRQPFGLSSFTRFFKGSYKSSY